MRRYTKEGMKMEEVQSVLNNIDEFKAFWRSFKRMAEDVKRVESKLSNMSITDDIGKLSISEFSQLVEDLEATKAIQANYPHIMHGYQTHQRKTGLARIKEVLRQYASKEKPMRNQDIHDRTGIPKRSLSTMLNQLKKSGEIQADGRDYWI